MELHGGSIDRCLHLIIAVPVAHVKTETPLVRRVHHAQLAQRQAHAETTVVLHGLAGMMSAHCVRVQRVTELPVPASSTTAQAVHRPEVQVVRVNLTIVQPDHVVRTVLPLVHGAQMIVLRAQEATAIVRRVPAVQMIVRRVRGAQMIVHRAREVLMSARPVVVAPHSVDQQKDVVDQVKVAVVRARAEVVPQRAVVAQVRAVVVQLLAGQQKVGVVRSVKMIVQ